MVDDALGLLAMVGVKSCDEWLFLAGVTGSSLTVVCFWFLLFSGSGGGVAVLFLAFSSAASSSVTLFLCFFCMRWMIFNERRDMEDLSVTEMGDVIWCNCNFLARE